MDDVLQFVLLSLVRLIHGIQPMLVPLCFVLAWGILAITGWSVWAALRDGVTRAHQMHQIPCSRCRYFSGDYHLKCPVHPHAALTEAAIHCADFEDADPSVRFSKAISALEKSQP